MPEVGEYSSAVRFIPPTCSAREPHGVLETHVGMAHMAT